MNTMKRTLQILLLALLASTAGAASATESKVETAKESVSTTAVTADLPDIPSCRGALSQDIVNVVQAATRNPRKALDRMRRQGTSNLSKASVECASRLWQALHPKMTRAERKAAAQLARTSEMRREGAEASGGRTVSGPLSPAGKRALSREDAEHEFVADETPYTGPYVDHRPVDAIRTPALRKVHPIPPPRRGDGDGEAHREPVRPVPPTEVGGPDGPRQQIEGASVSAPTPAGVAFDGIGVGLGGFSPSSNPPDVNGRVGGSQYVQWNNSSFAVFSKTTGALLYGPAAGNTLFQSLGGPCATHNDGDPVVSYDLLAGRWVLSQFVVEATPNASHQCFAVSVTDDALGSYYLYDFVTDPTNFVDYPHTGVWPDGYYMTTHVFNPAGTAQVAARVHVFERDKMLLGLPARQVQKDLKKDGTAFQYGFVPADLDSLTPPPAGEPSFILGPNGQFTNRTDSTRVAVTWGVTPTITLTEATITTIGIATPTCVSNTNGRDCVPQPSPAVAADYLDNISFHYMYRLAYRNFGGSPVQESLVVSAPTAGSASSPGHGAIKWIEFRNAGGLTTTPTVFQSGTFDPDTAYRWLPSIAMDKDHNIAVGYSKSSTSIKPGIYMTGRLGTDTINTMGAETTVQAGVGSQTSGAGNRWGDYSAMTLDPVDQCTFWYTNEYLKANGAFNWSTRVATYKFPSCTAAAAWGTISGTITSCATGAPLSGVVVTLSNGYAGTSDASGNYTILVPAGTYSASAADAARNCTSGSPATVSVISTSGGTTNQNFCMSGDSNLQTNGLTIDDASNGNNNGIVNRNECVKLNIPLKNNGCATETGISATLTTATAGVTVTQANSTYSNLVIDASSVNATPFQFQTSNAFVCGTVINFTLTVTYASGNKALGISIPTCGGGANQTIPSSSLTAGDLTQSDRLGRDGVPSTCAGKSGSGGFAGTKFYKTFTFTNNSGTATCYTVNINAALGGAGDIQSEAYSPTYNPAAITTNLLGDTGITGLGTTVGSASYSFTVPALANFVVVVNTTGTTTSSVFSGTVSGFLDTTPGPGPCPGCTPPPTPTVTPGGPTTFCQGGNVTLTSSSATGNQWYNGLTLLAGETNQNYIATTSGNYNVVVTVAGCPSAPSASTAVTVNPIPATPTVTPGGPTTFCTGGSVTLTSSSATGNQWYNGVTLLAGQTNQAYVATTSGNYNVIVTASGCSSAPSSSTAVTVNPTPATPTVTPGGPTTFCAGGSVTLTSSSATGNQWYNGVTLLAGQTNQTYVATTTGNYNVVVTTAGCPSAPSTSTAVTVNPIPATPTITPGGPTTFCTGGSVTLTSSSASGNQWYDGLTLLVGQTNQTYVATTTGNYNVVVTASGCSSAPSSSTAVTVNPIPATPTVTPGGPTTFCSGGSVTLTSSSATGNQWFNGVTLLVGQTNQAYVATTSGNYNVVVTTSGCSSAPSSSTAVTVNPTPTTPTITPGGPTTFCTGGSVTLTSSSATGNQWFNGLTPLAGETNQNYIATASGNYNVVVTASGCSSAPSASTAVTVNPIPATPTVTPGGPTTFCSGGSVTLTSSSATGNQWFNGVTLLVGQTNQAYVATTSGNYNVVVTTNGCSSAPSSSTAVTVNPTPATPTITPGGPTTFCTGGSVTLTSSSATGNQWFNGVTLLVGQTNQAYVATTSGNYNVVVTASGCSSAPSASTAVTVNPIPATPTVTPGGPTTFCSGGSVTLTSSSASGNQWYDGVTLLPGETNQAYVATASGNYNVVVTTSGCSSAHSASTAVTVNPAPATPTVTPGGSTTFCTGGSVTLTSSSGTGNQWYDGVTLLVGETNQIYIASSTGNYNVVVTAGGCSSAHSASTIVTVNPIPATPTVTPGGPTTFCAGGSVTLTSSSATGNQWYDGAALLAGETNQNYVATTSGNYNVVVTTNGCSSAHSASTAVTVNPAPATPTITPGGPTTFCAGGSVTLTSSSASGNQWFKDANPISGATAQQYLATATGSYTVVVTAGCSSASSATAVTVNPIPALPTISPTGETSFCEGGSLLLTSSSATGNQWYRNGIVLPGETAQTYVATIAGFYTVMVTTNGCTSSASLQAIVSVNPKPDATITVASPMFSGASATASVAVSCAGASFAWTITGGTITDGAGTPAITFTAGAAGTLTLQVTVTTSAGCSDTKSANVTVQNASFGPPPFFQANASGTTSANLNWAPVQSADHYEIHRSTDNVNWTLRGTSGGTTFSEGGLTPSTTYFYKVRTVKADTTLSAFSAIDPATMMVFTDDPLGMCGSVIKAVHITQLRTAVNIARAGIGLSAFTFTDPALAAGAVVKAVHIAELRTALAPLLTAIAITPSYTDPTITGGATKVKNTHIRELRDRIR
jgi:hypothetical protein